MFVCVPYIANAVWSIKIPNRPADRHHFCVELLHPLLRIAFAVGMDDEIRRQKAHYIYVHKKKWKERAGLNKTVSHSTDRICRTCKYGRHVEKIIKWTMALFVIESRKRSWKKIFMSGRGGRCVVSSYFVHSVRSRALVSHASGRPMSTAVITRIYTEWPSMFAIYAYKKHTLSS